MIVAWRASFALSWIRYYPRNSLIHKSKLDTIQNIQVFVFIDLWGQYQVRHFFNLTVVRCAHASDEAG